MIDLGQFVDLRLHCGFIIKAVGFAERPLLDALEREAVAQTRIVGGSFAGSSTRV